MADDQSAEQPPDFRQIGREFGAGLDDTGAAVRNFGYLQNALTNSFTFVIAGLIKIAGWVAVTLARQLMKAEAASDSAFQELAAAGAEDLFGVRINVQRGGPGGGKKLSAGAARSLGDAVLKTIANTSGATAGGTLQPTMAGAEGYLTNVLGMVFEGWLEGAIVSSCSLGYLGKFGDLDDLVYNALGFGRLSRRVLSPLVDATVVKPAEWHINKTYRPNLLSESLAVKQFLRGKWTREQLDEELARQGWSPDRIEAHIAAQTKTLSLEEAMTLKRVGVLDDAAVQKLLRDNGYDDVTAASAVNAHAHTRLEALNQAPLASVRRAWVNGDIDRAEMEGFAGHILDDKFELANWLASADLEKRVSVRHLSAGEVIDCCKLRILPTSFYREWLEREGYPQAEQFALELRLRMEMTKDAEVESERKKLQAERAADKQQRADAAAQRKADVEAERALHRRGPTSALERAVVRGLIPLARLEEVLAVEFDADTVGILTGLVEADRLAFIEQQRRADEARQRAGRRNIDVGDLERAVLNDVLSVPEFRQRLGALQFEPADADLLTATLAARKADIDQARATRAEAEARAKRRTIDLGRAERLVRRGAATLAQYEALLASLGYEDGSRAAMIELVKLDIADDAAARTVREDAAARAKVKGISLEQFRRAVLTGTRTDDEFQSYLVSEGYTVDAQRVLVAELRRDVVDADAARRKRVAAEAASGVAELPLSRVTRAARLGLVSPATYQARLVRSGLTADDIAIEMDLLVAEIADVQAARARRDALAGELDAPKALSLAQLEAAVKAGVAAIGDYRAAVAAVYAAADVDLLVDTLSAELAAAAESRERRGTIDGELKARTLNLGQLEAAVKADRLTLDAYNAQLVAWGYGSDDADLLTSLLFDELLKGGAA